MFSKVKLGGRPLGATGSTPGQSVSPGQSSGGTPPSLLAPDLHVKGDLHSQGDLQIDGKVDGDIHSETLTVGRGALVNGSIYGGHVRIAGTVNGEITARTVELLSTARMTGDISHDSLSVEAGAYIQGTCKRVDVELLTPAINKKMAKTLSIAQDGKPKKLAVGA